ncbi:MAG: hypothetical protein HC850_17840 [Rhodomicrobium sp.]|nr:hypothetical protein [Rhodomicrobium sp.]
MKLPTRIGVVTNIDPEHLDYYGSVEAMYDAYRRFFNGIKPGGAAVAGIDHPVVREFAGEAKLPTGARLLRYGVAEDADIRLEAVRSNGGSVHLDAALGNAVEGGPRVFDDMTLAVPGHYNALNAMAAVASPPRRASPTISSARLWPPRDPSWWRLSCPLHRCNRFK